MRVKYLEILKNSSWTSAEKFLRMITSLFVTSWFIRYLGPSDYGIYAFSISVVGLLIPISRMGLNKISTRDLAKRPELKDLILGTSLAIETVGGLLVVPLSIILTAYLRPEQPRLFYFVFLISLAEIFRSFEVIDFWFTSQMQSKYVALCNSVAYMAGNCLKILLIFINAELVFFWLFTHFSFYY